MATATEIKNFINKLGKLAIAESNRRISSGGGFVLPSVCIAQSALETGWGSSGLMTRANAFFGIKAGGSWTGKVYTADTWEVADGQAYNTTANFRAYDSLEESVRDYYDLIANNSRYSNALSYGTGSSKWKTPRECITAIWAGGYATDTLYVQKIMNTITARDLAVFDSKIDGVSFTAPADTQAFSVTSFIAGALAITDSGRTISNVDKANAFSSDWSKAPTIESDTTFNVKINDPEGVIRQVNIATLIADTPNIEATIGGELVVKAGTKIGVYLDIDERAGGDINDLKNVVITFEAPSISEGSEVVKSALAYWVKIE